MPVATSIRAPERPFLGIALTAIGVFTAEEHHPHWSYGGSTGPANWGTLEHDYGSCALGKTQSPIDIREERFVHKADSGQSMCVPKSSVEIQ